MWADNPLPFNGNAELEAATSASDAFLLKAPVKDTRKLEVYPIPNELQQEYCTALLRVNTTLEIFPSQVTRKRRAVYKNMDYFKQGTAHLCFFYC